MTTPYDMLVRLQKREVDEVRLRIGVEISHIAQIDSAQEHLREEIMQECAVAQQDCFISTHHYLRDRARRGAKLMQSRAEHDAALARLRTQATEAYGGLRVAENAADSFARKAAAERMRKDQAEADDLSSARRLLKLRRERLAAQKFAL